MRETDVRDGEPRGCSGRVMPTRELRGLSRFLPSPSFSLLALSLFTMTLARRVALALSLLGLSVSSVSGAEPAWNGKMLPGAAQDPSNPAPFLPYYVPAGESP